VRRLAILAGLIAACGALAAAPAGATNECRGLQVCVPVAGPWVVTPRSGVQYQLSCPKHYIVAGLDAELAARGIDVGFVGKLGSPVNPGSTTTQTALFLGRTVRGPTSSFRPHIGCVPASGGGGRTQTAYHPFPPSNPTTVRAVQVHVHAGTTRKTVHCSNNESLVSATHAVGFYGDRPPSAALATAITVSHRVHNGRVALTVHASFAAAAASAVVQVDLVCTSR
jgi:hypothetical protein